MVWDDVVIFTLLALLAEIAGTISGFGSSVFFVPIASLFFDFHSVLGITACFHLFSNISKIFLFRKGFDKKLVLYLGIPAVIFVSLGAFLSKYVNSTYLELGLAGFLMLFSAFFMFAGEKILRPTKLNSMAGGVVSGFVAGLLGTGGAIRGMTLAAFGLTKEVFIATSAMIDFGVDLSRGAIYFSNGFVHLHDIPYIAILLVISIIGTFIGKKILTKISEERFRFIVLIAIFAIALFTVVGLLIK
jgi:uncharacterized membrane protein YfcA